MEKKKIGTIDEDGEEFFPLKKNRYENETKKKKKKKKKKGRSKARPMDEEDFVMPEQDEPVA